MAAYKPKIFISGTLPNMHIFTFFIILLENHGSLPHLPSSNHSHPLRPISILIFNDE